MTPMDFVLTLIDAAGERVQGRTLLQKTGYFGAELSGKADEFGYSAHYYGPYSALVDAALTKLKSMGFVDEATTGFGVCGPEGFEIKRYDYRLTDDGREVLAAIRESEGRDYDTLRENTRRVLSVERDYFTLSVAAKAHFILKRLNRSMSRAEIMKEAKRFDWDITPDVLNRAVIVLEQLNLARNTPVQ